MTLTAPVRNCREFVRPPSTRHSFIAHVIQIFYDTLARPPVWTDCRRNAGRNDGIFTGGGGGLWLMPKTGIYVLRQIKCVMFFLFVCVCMWKHIAELHRICGHVVVQLAHSHVN